MAIRRWARNLNPELEAPLPAIDVMRDNMDYWHRRARSEAMALREALTAGGATPDQMLKLVALYHNSRSKSQDVARDLIPYETPRLSQMTIRTLDLTSLDDAELNQALLSMGIDLDSLVAEVDAEAVLEEVPEAVE